MRVEVYSDVGSTSENGVTSTVDNNSSTSVAEDDAAAPVVLHGAVTVVDDET